MAVLAPQATFRLLKGARAALGDTPHVDMLLRRLMLVVLHRADTALFHKLVGGARPILAPHHARTPRQFQVDHLCVRQADRTQHPTLCSPKMSKNALIGEGALGGDPDGPGPCCCADLLEQGQTMMYLLPAVMHPWTSLHR